MYLYTHSCQVFDNGYTRYPLHSLSVTLVIRYTRPRTNISIAAAAVGFTVPIFTDCVIGVLFDKNVAHVSSSLNIVQDMPSLDAQYTSPACSFPTTVSPGGNEFGLYHVDKLNGRISGFVPSFGLCPKQFTPAVLLADVHVLTPGGPSPHPATFPSVVMGNFESVESLTHPAEHHSAPCRNALVNSSVEATRPPLNCEQILGASPNAAE